MSPKLRGRHAKAGGSGTLQQRIDAATAGSTLGLYGLTFTAGATVNKALTIVGGTIAISTDTIALTIAASNVTIQNMTITGPGDTGALNTGSYGIVGSGSGLVLTGNRISGFRLTGISLEDVTSPTIHGNTVTDCSYTGIELLSATGGTIDYNTVQRIGYDGHDADNHNAYGIILSFAGGPVSSGVLVDHNLVEDVPLWHGLDTHFGSDLTWSNNIVRRCPRAIFLPGGTYQTVTNNHFGPPNAQMAWECSHGVGYCTDNVALTLYNCDHVAITGNTADTYPLPWYDYEGNSTDVTLSGNTPDNTLVKP
jgi:parallel beta-helix repeat protein